MTIDYVALSKLQKGGSMLDQLRGHDENDEENDEVGTHVGANDPVPEKVNTAGGAQGDEENHETEACALQDPG